MPLLQDHGEPRAAVRLWDDDTLRTGQETVMKLKAIKDGGYGWSPEGAGEEASALVGQVFTSGYEAVKAYQNDPVIQRLGLRR
jgi:hypothetical protein